MKAKNVAKQLFLETHYFVDNDYFLNTLESYGSALPIGVHLISKVNRDRVTLLADRRKSGEAEYVIARFGCRVALVEMFRSGNEGVAWTVFEEMRSLNLPQLTMAFYLSHSGRAFSDSDVPAQTRAWAGLDVPEQDVIWSFMNADVPGNFWEILELARKCGCVESHIK